MNEAPEQLSSPPVLYSWLRHLFTWVQQPSHGLLSLQLPLPRGTIVLQSKGGGGGGSVHRAAWQSHPLGCTPNWPLTPQT